MSERVRLRYHSDDPSPVALPAYMNARPSIVEPGDVVEVDEQVADAALATEERDGEPVRLDPRWERVDVSTEIGPYAGVSLAELRATAEKRDVDLTGRRSRADVIAALEAADLADPEPPGNPDEDATITTEGDTL